MPAQSRFEGQNSYATVRPALNHASVWALTLTCSYASALGARIDVQYLACHMGWRPTNVNLETLRPENWASNVRRVTFSILNWTLKPMPHKGFPIVDSDDAVSAPYQTRTAVVQGPVYDVDRELE